ncbi:hypothetical protein [Magnetovibrio sp.]|uniref:hypothetical protein n=1 Tax=Magnetovibrio sp. TaxID=2024836 RepID=UPI002F924033
MAKKKAGKVEDQLITIISRDMHLPGMETQAEVATIPGAQGANLHAFGFSSGSKSSKAKFDDVLASWQETRERVAKLAKDMTSGSFGKLELSELEFNLGISAEGTIGIASTTAEASIVLKFTKQKS